MLLSDSPVALQEIPVILNGLAGCANALAAREQLKDAFRDAGIEARVWMPHAGEDIRNLARRALREHPPILAAAGGDGTLSAIADVVRATPSALGILPLGTFNHFARDLGVPLELAEAVKVIAIGRRAAIDLGEVNGRCFLNNCSLGLYPDVVRSRTRQQQRLRRSKRAAMLWATLAMLGRTPLLELKLELEACLEECRAPFIFVSNNPYLIEGFDIGVRERLDSARLGVYFARRSSGAGLIGLALRALFGRLRYAKDFSALRVKSLTVHGRRARLRVALDGELGVLGGPLRFRVLPRALEVIRP